MDNQPKGIGFFNIKTGKTHYAQMEAQIQAYINSSDMGINASRDQDFGWRLEPEWVKAVKAFRRNETKMEALTTRNGGQRVTTPQILYAIYGEQLRAAQERADENEAPFEEKYLSDISSKAEPKSEPAIKSDIEDNLDDLDFDEEGVDDGNTDTPTDSAEDTAEPLQEEPTASDSDQPADLPEEPSATKAPGKTKKK